MPGPTSLPPAYIWDDDDTAQSTRHGDLLHQVDREELRALWTKLGLGVSVPAAGQVLRGTGAGSSAFGPVVNGDVDASAGIAVSKLAHVGAGNVLRSNGSANVAGQVQTGDVAAGAVNRVLMASAASATLVNTTAMTVITGMTITWTPTAGYAFNMLSVALFAINCNVLYTLAPLDIYLDGLRLGYAFFGRMEAGIVYSNSTVASFSGLSATPHTVDVRWQCPSASSTMGLGEGRLLLQEMKR